MSFFKKSQNSLVLAYCDGFRDNKTDHEDRVLNPALIPIKDHLNVICGIKTEGEKVTNKKQLILVEKLRQQEQQLIKNTEQYHADFCRYFKHCLSELSNDNFEKTCMAYLKKTGWKIAKKTNKQTICFSATQKRKKHTVFCFNKILSTQQISDINEHIKKTKTANIMFLSLQKILPPIKKKLIVIEPVIYEDKDLIERLSQEKIGITQETISVFHVDDTAFPSVNSQ